MRFDPERVRRNVEQASTEDLLDRVTVYRPGMEPEALAMIEAELRARGVSAEDIEEHAAEHARSIIPFPDGTARPCTFCHRPAVAEGWGWHWIWGKLPVFPRYYFYCREHQPVSRDAESAERTPRRG